MNHTVKLLGLFIFVTLFGGLLISQSASAARPTKGPSLVGHDISYPQCDKTLPTGQAFGIVGINGGMATTMNRCLTEQLLWAESSTGANPKQAKLQLYVNTGNPGQVLEQYETAWPKSGDSLKYGECNGTDTKACSYLYGRERAIAQEQMYRDATAGTTLSGELAGKVIWLDVETENSWQAGSSVALENNRATLEAMTDYFTEKQAIVGIYSTNYQWGVIAGTVPSTSSLYKLNSWMAGARTQKGAQTNCKNPPLVAGGKIVLTQWVSAGLDYDISCN